MIPLLQKKWTSHPSPATIPFLYSLDSKTPNLIFQLLSSHSHRNPSHLGCATHHFTRVALVKVPSNPLRGQVSLLTYFVNLTVELSLFSKDFPHLVSRTQHSWFSFYLTGNFSSVVFASSSPSSQPWNVSFLRLLFSPLTLSDLIQFSGHLPNLHTNSR